MIAHFEYPAFVLLSLLFWFFSMLILIISFMDYEWVKHLILLSFHAVMGTKQNEKEICCLFPWFHAEQRPKVPFKLEQQQKYFFSRLKSNRSQSSNLSDMRHGTAVSMHEIISLCSAQCSAYKTKDTHFHMITARKWIEIREIHKK